jgi:hypothetical protein
MSDEEQDDLSKRSERLRLKTSKTLAAADTDDGKTQATKKLCIVCDQRQPPRDCPICCGCCRQIEEDCPVRSHAFRPEPVEEEQGRDLASDALVDLRSDVLVGQSTPRSSGVTTQGSPSTALLFNAIQALTARFDALEMGGAPNEGAQSRSPDLVESLGRRATSALDGDIRSELATGRTRSNGRRPPQRRSGFATRRDEFFRSEEPRRDDRRRDARRDDPFLHFEEGRRDDEAILGFGTGANIASGEQIGINHPEFPAYILQQMQPDPHAWARGTQFTNAFREKEMCMLGLAVSRLVREGAVPDPGGGLAVLLRRMAAINSLECGHAGDLADAIEEPGARFSLVPQLALSQATLLAEKRRKLRQKSSSLSDKNPNDAAKPRRGL